MLAKTLEEQLHSLARCVAESLIEPDRRQLRYNDIVAVAQIFYDDPFSGVHELVVACDRKRLSGDKVVPNPLYVQGRPMWQVLQQEYSWVV